MKHLVIIIALSFLAFVDISAQTSEVTRSINISWDEHPEEIASFKVYWRKTPEDAWDLITTTSGTTPEGKRTSVDDVPIPDVPEGGEIALTAVNPVGLESLPSESVKIPPKPGGPGSPEPPTGVKGKIKIKVNVEVEVE